jgi:hypothetical protein
LVLALNLPPAHPGAEYTVPNKQSPDNALRFYRPIAQYMRPEQEIEADGYKKKPQKNANDMYGPYAQNKKNKGQN